MQDNCNTLLPLSLRYNDLKLHKSYFVCRTINYVPIAILLTQHNAFLTVTATNNINAWNTIINSSYETANHELKLENTTFSPSPSTKSSRDPVPGY